MKNIAYYIKIRTTRSTVISIQSINQPIQKVLTSRRGQHCTVQIITVHKIQNRYKQKIKKLLWLASSRKQIWFLRCFLKVSRLCVRRMSAGSAFQARGTATESARSPILVRVWGMSKVRLLAERRCDVADVSVTRLVMYSLVHTREQHHT